VKFDQLFRISFIIVYFVFLFILFGLCRFIRDIIFLFSIFLTLWLGISLSCPIYINILRMDGDWCKSANVCSQCSRTYLHNNYLRSHTRCDLCGFIGCARCILGEESDEALISSFITNPTLKDQYKRKLSAY
jgi:hypothetical protein